MAARKVTRQDLRDASEKYKNWGKWGPNDEIGTLNYTSPDDIIAAAQLVKKGKVISLALNFDHTGPQGAKSKYPAMGRTNPIHTMLRTGTDAYSGVLDKRGIRAADDMVTMPLQCGTQWDGLGHVFYENYMWNGYDCREVTSAGAQKCGIEKTKNKMVGRGVLLDVARYKGVDSLDDGYGITNDDLYATAKKQNVALKRGDYVIVRTGMMERCQKAGSWDGYPGGDAPGFAFETLDFVKRHRARRARERHLGLRGATERERGRHQPALALDHDPDHGHDHGRDLRAQGAGGRLRRRQGLRVPVRRAGDPDHRRGRLAGQPAGDQVASERGKTTGQRQGRNDMRLILRGIVLSILTVAASDMAVAQKWPERTIRFVVSQAAGNATDIIARVVADQLTSRLGQPVVVENRPGGGNVIGTQIAARSAPDGYTFFLATAAALVTDPYTFKSLPYDPMKDFVPVARVAEVPFVILANPKVPAKDFKDADRARQGSARQAHHRDRRAAAVLRHDRVLDQQARRHRDLASALHRAADGGAGYRRRTGQSRHRRRAGRAEPRRRRDSFARSR